MFTGIIEEVGTVRSIVKSGKENRLGIACTKILDDVNVGDSIAVNGVCLTVVEYGTDWFSADVMNESLSRSNLGELRNGHKVNLERAMPAYGRFGGHIVSGHIDGTGRVKSIHSDGNAIWYQVSCAKDILAGIVEKGSIAIDGISLTVAKIDGTSFSVSIIPHTLDNTILESKQVGDVVNLENDIIGKYVMKNMEGEKKSGGLSKELLMKNGFLS